MVEPFQQNTSSAFSPPSTREPTGRQMTLLPLQYRILSPFQKNRQSQSQALRLFWLFEKQTEAFKY